MEDVASGVAFDSANRILIAGHTFVAGPVFAAARLTPDGAMDSSFDSDGRQTISLGSFSYGTSLAVDSADRVVIGGYANINATDIALARLTVGGALDGLFIRMEKSHRN